MATKLPAKDVVIIGLGWTGAILTAFVASGLSSEQKAGGSK
jgi:hypothetical protein